MLIPALSEVPQNNIGRGRNFCLQKFLTGLVYFLLFLLSVDTSRLKDQIDQNLTFQPLNSLVRASPYQTSQCIEEILPHLLSIEGSTLFQKFWDENGLFVAESHEGPQKIRIEDVVEKIWKPSLIKLVKLGESLTNLEITLGEVNEHFSGWKEADIAKEMKFLTNTNIEIHRCMKKIKIHMSLNKYRDGAAAVVKAAEALEWEGDMTVLQSIVDAVSPKGHYINRLNNIGHSCETAYNIVSEWDPMKD